MGVAAQRLTNQMADRNRVHLNGVAEAVFGSHAGHPVSDVLAVLMRQSESPLYQPEAGTLMPAARAISRRRRFVFV
jgi:hypothetical protein